MTDGDLFTTFVTTTPEQLIRAVEQLLEVAWNTGADAALEHTVEGLPVISSEDADIHDLEFVRSKDFAGDDGTSFTAVMNRAAPVVTRIVDATTAAWGEPNVARNAEDLQACTLLEVAMHALGVDEVLAWQREERYILFFEGLYQESDEYAAAFWVASRSVVEDVAYDISAQAQDSDAAGQRSLLEERLAERLGPQMVFPEPLCRAWSFMESRGWGTIDAHEDPILTPYPGEEQLGVVFSSALSTRGWLDPDAPGAERLVPIAETDGSGGFAAIWFDEASAPRFVWFSSEGGEPKLLADDPVDFLRLIAIGYSEFADWVWGAPPDSFEDTLEDEQEEGEELPMSDPVTAHGEFRAWVEAEFDVEMPEVWTVSDDAEFDAWLEAMVDAHGIGDETVEDSVGGRGEDAALHQAAESLSSESVQRQLDAGADPDAQDSWGWTPLDLVAFSTEYWRAQEALNAASLLIGVSAKKSIASNAASHLRREFRDGHRAHANGNFRSDQLQAFRDLLELLSVPEPVVVKPLAPGEQITVASQGWKRQFSELWQLLVPENGPAESVQGEVIRIAGRVGHEILTNGGGNWDEDFEAMLDAFLTFSTRGEPLPNADHDRARQAAEGLRGGQFSEEDVDEMTRASVAWVLLNPTPILLPSQPYGR